MTEITTQEVREGEWENLARPARNAQTNATFKIKRIIFVTLSPENDKMLFEQLRPGLKRTIKWNKCKWEMTNQNKNFNQNKQIYLFNQSNIY